MVMSILVVLILSLIVIEKLTYNIKPRKLRRYKKAKAKAKNKDWLLRQKRFWADKDKDNARFRTFECSTFFRGEKTANLNLDIYLEEQKKIDRKFEQAEFLLSLLEK